MESIKFPIVIAKNIGKENFLKWREFYKIREGKRLCSREEGLWRRTQEKANQIESGWKNRNDKRRRMIHYEHEFDVLKRNNVYDFCLIKTYIWLHICLPLKEIEKYREDIIGSPYFNKWWKKISSRNNEDVFRCGDLFLEIRKIKNHVRDIKAKRSFPLSYEILEIALYSKNNKKGEAFAKKPWLVLSTGIRKKELRGKPAIAKSISKIVPYLPSQVEIGGGASIESGVYPLSFLHGIYSVADKKKKFVFSFNKDKFAASIANDPLDALKRFSLMHKKIILSNPGSFYEKLKSLHKQKFFVGPIITNNFDGFIRQMGLEELFVRRYSDNIKPTVTFNKDAKSLMVVGVHADRRGIQKLARKNGLKVVYVDPEGYERKNGKFIACPLESPQDDDIVIKKNASQAFDQLEKEVKTNIPIKLQKSSKKVQVIFTGKRTKLSSDSQNKIDSYWEKLLSSGKEYYRGEVFTIEKIVENKKEITVNISLTDYAHYIYTFHHPGEPKEMPCKVAHAVVLIETADKYLVLGKMAEHTAHAGSYQCVGGGIDSSDVVRERIDFQKNICRELEEEVGLKIVNKTLIRSMKKKYLKTRGVRNSFAVIYKMKLHIDRKEFAAHFLNFQKNLRKKGEKPEFEKMIYIDNKNFYQNIEKIKNKAGDYLVPLFEAEFSSKNSSSKKLI